MNYIDFKICVRLKYMYNLSVASCNKIYETIRNKIGD